MIGAAVGGCFLVEARTGRNIDLAADDRMDSGPGCCLIKLYGAVHDAVIGHCDGGLSVLPDALHEAVDPAGTVEQ